MLLQRQNCLLKTDVVNSEIPLLLGKPSMKTAKVKLYIGNDKINIIGKDILVHYTSSGHYSISLQDDLSASQVKHVVMTTKDVDMRKALLKRHRQFAHPSNHRVKLLINDAGITDDRYSKLIEVISDKCDICKKLKKNLSRPVVCMLLARDLNEVVAMEL